jgi:uncharacterized protein (DUF433 family)
MFGYTSVQVNNLIDEVAPVGVAHVGSGKREVEYRGLFALLLAEELVFCQLKPELRYRVLERAVATRANRITVPGTNVSVLAQPYRERALEGVRRLYEAEEAVQSHRDIMHGEPCVKGTRIPVYIVAAIAGARGREEAIATYPNLDLRQVELAEVYAKAHPRRGRPRTTAVPSEGVVVARKTIGRTKAR